MSYVYFQLGVWTWTWFILGNKKFGPKYAVNSSLLRWAITRYSFSFLVVHSHLLLAIISMGPLAEPPPTSSTHRLMYSLAHLLASSEVGLHLLTNALAYASQLVGTCLHALEVTLFPLHDSDPKLAWVPPWTSSSLSWGSASKVGMHMLITH